MNIADPLKPARKLVSVPEVAEICGIAPEKRANHDDRGSYTNHQEDDYTQRDIV